MQDEGRVRKCTQAKVVKSTSGKFTQVHTNPMIQSGNPHADASIWMQILALT